MLALDQGTYLYQKKAGRKHGGRPPSCCRICLQTLLLCLPEGLDLRALLEQHGLRARWENQKRQHKLAFVVHSILERSHRDARHGKPAFYVPLNAQHLRHFIGAADTAPAVATLVSTGVIEQSPNNYSAGRFSRSYRLTETYREMPVVFRELTNATLARRVHLEQSTRNTEAVAGNQVRATVLRNLEALTVSPAGERLAATRCFKSDAEQAAWMLPIADLQQRRLWLAADEKTGRIFHNVTQCPAELRRHLLIDGEETAEVDMANAQPFLLLSLYPKGGVTASERLRYANAVSSGHFYQNIFVGCRERRQWGTNSAAWAVSGNTHRERFKKHFIEKVLYSVLNPKKEPQVFGSFRQLFPWLAAQLAVKRSTKGAARSLALEMQSQEAALVLARVFPRIAVELPACKAISIHDGILCQARFAKKVAEIVRSEARVLYGVAPLVRLK